MKLHLNRINVIIVELLCAGIFCAGSAAFAQTFVGTILAVQGDVKILHLPQAGAHGPFAKLHGKKYVYHLAKIGQKLSPGEIVLSGTNGKIRIVYPNGDTFFIGKASSFVLPVDLKNAATQNNPHQNVHANSMLKMFYGRFRALISKVGPRNHLRIVTPDAIAGVRGTDFFTRSNANIGTELTVLRGAVAFRNAKDPSQIVTVKTGFSADSSTKSHSAPRVIQTTRSELAKIHRQSEVKISKRAIAKLPKAQQQELHKLQRRAFKSVMADIRAHNPALYQNLRQRNVKNIDQIDTFVVANLWRNAPTMRMHKPTAKALEGSGRHVYRKYYRPHPHLHHHFVPRHHR